MFVRVGFGTNTTALNAGGSLKVRTGNGAVWMFVHRAAAAPRCVHSHCRFSFCNHSATEQLHPLGVCG